MFRQMCDIVDYCARICDTGKTSVCNEIVIEKLKKKKRWDHRIFPKINLKDSLGVNFIVYYSELIQEEALTSFTGRAQNGFNIPSDYYCACIQHFSLAQNLNLFGRLYH